MSELSAYPEPAEIGQTIQTLRQRANMSQKELAERSNLSQAQVSQMEHGKTNPSLEALNSVARALGVPTWVLIAGLALLAVGAMAAVTRSTKTE